MTTYTVIPNVPPYFTDLDGNPAPGYQLFTYVSGTTTKQNTYNGADSTTASANTNPIILDSSGWASIFLPPGTSYKFVLAPPTDTDPPSNPLWSRDGISATAPYGTSTDINGRSGENVAVNDVVYLSDGTGGLTAGSWYLTDADFSYKSATPDQIGVVLTVSGSTITVRIKGTVTNFTSLSSGQTYYVGSTAGAVSTTGYRKVGSVLSVNTSFIVNPDPPTPDNVDIIATSDGTIAAGSCVYPLKGTATWIKAKADVATASGWSGNIFGFAMTTATGASTFVVRTQGIVTGLSGLTVGSLYYMHGSTVGAITATAPNPNRIVGIAVSTTALQIMPTPAQNTYAQFTPVGNVGAGVDNLMSFTFNPDLYLGNITFLVKGAFCEVTFSGTTAANANNKQIKVLVGGTTVVDSGVVTANNLPWYGRMTIWSSATPGSGFAEGFISFNGSANIVGYSAVTISDTTVIQLTGEATATDDIVNRFLSVDFKGF